MSLDSTNTSVLESSGGPEFNETSHSKVNKIQAEVNTQVNSSLIEDSETSASSTVHSSQTSQSDTAEGVELNEGLELDETEVKGNLAEIKKTSSQVWEPYTMPEKEKFRVYVAVYFEDSVTSDPEIKYKGHNRYHWAIMVESKDGKESDVFDVKYHAKMNLGTGGSTPEGWRYEAKYKIGFSRRLLAKILIGKLPDGMTPEDIGTALAPPQVRLPIATPDSKVEDSCIEWEVRAIKVLQMTGKGQVADPGMDVDKCIDYCAGKADERYKKNPRLELDPAKGNFGRGLFGLNIGVGWYKLYKS